MQIRRGTRTDQSGDEKRPERQAAITSQWGLRAGWESELWTLGHGPTMGPRWLWGTGMKQSNLSYRKLTGGQEKKVVEREFWGEEPGRKAAEVQAGDTGKPAKGRSGGAGRKGWAQILIATRWVRWGEGRETPASSEGCFPSLHLLLPLPTPFPPQSIPLKCPLPFPNLDCLIYPGLCAPPPSILLSGDPRL